MNPNRVRRWLWIKFMAPERTNYENFSRLEIPPRYPSYLQPQIINDNNTILNGATNHHQMGIDIKET